MGLLSSSEILAANDWPTEDVDCPEWGGSVRVRSMSAAAVQEFNEKYFGEDGKAKPEYDGKMLAAWVLWSTVDEAGNRLFTEEQLDDLSKKFEKPLLRVFQAARRVNGELEDAAKN